MERLIEAAVVLYVVFGIVAGILKRGSGNPGPVLQQPRRPSLSGDFSAQDSPSVGADSEEYRVSGSIDEEAGRFDAASPKIFEDFAETAGDVELPDEEGMGLEGQNTSDDGEGVSLEGPSDGSTAAYTTVTSDGTPKIRLEGIAAAMVLSEIVGRPRARKPWSPRLSDN